jgi:hypothetical protein
MGAVDATESLFLYVVREIDGLTPNTAYQARFCATVATLLHVDSLFKREYLKLGVSARMPSRIEVDSSYGPYYILDVDKGRLPRSSGSAAVYAGEVGREDTGSGWALVTREPVDGLTVTADSQGKVWLLAGVESTYWGPVEIYWVELEIELNPAP